MNSNRRELTLNSNKKTGIRLDSHHDASPYFNLMQTNA